MKRRSIICSLLILLTSLMPLYVQADTVEHAVELLHQGKLKEAVMTIEEVVDKRPHDSNAQITLAYILMRTGEYERARKILLTALKNAGEHPVIHRLLAEIAAQQGDFPLAFEEIELATALDPQNKETLRLKEKLSKEWQIEEKMNKNYGGNFTVTFEGGGDAIGQAALAVLEEAYVELGGRFQCWPQEKTEVILYGNRDFKNLTNAPDWSGGLYDGKIRIPVGGVSEMNEKLRRILYHEYSHVLIFRLTRNHLPLWLNEGLAQWASGEDSAHLKHRLANGEKIIPFKNFDKSFASLNTDEASLAYAQSHSLTTFLIERFGEAEIMSLLSQFGSGYDFQTAGADILAPWEGDFNKLVKTWKQSIMR